MALDPSVILQGNQPGIDPAVLVTAYNLQQQVQKNQQAQQTQNALKAIYADPASLDDKGLPTTNALAKISRIDPNIGLQTVQQVAKAKDQMLQYDDAQLDHVEKQSQHYADTVAIPAQQAYEDTFAATGNRDAAIAAGQRAMATGRDQIAKDGWHTEDQLNQHPTTFDPVQNDASLEQFKTWRDARKEAAAEKAKAEDEKRKEAADAAKAAKDEADAARRDREDKDREAKEDRQFDLSEAHLGLEERRAAAAEGGANKWEILTDPKTSEQYRYNPVTAQATDLAGKPYTPAGAQKMDSGGGAHSGIAMAIKQFSKENPKATAADIADFAAQYGAGVREQGAIGQRTGQVEFSAGELDNAAVLSKDAYNKLPRGQFLTFNKLRQKVETETGSPEQAAAYAADNAVVNTYARMVSPTGSGTESDKSHAREMLNTAQSHEAHDAVVNQLMKEGEAAQAGAKQARGKAREHRVEPPAGAGAGGWSIQRVN